MGYRMCSNIHKKISGDANLFICDVDETVLENFVKESSGKAKITILNTPREITERAVSIVFAVTPVRPALTTVSECHPYDAASRPTRPTSLLRWREQLAFRCETGLSWREETLHRLQHD